MPVVSLLRPSSSATISFADEVLINNKKYINTLTPVVTVTTTDKISEFSIGEGAACDSHSWQTAATRYTLSLSPGEGDKTVSYRYKIGATHFPCQTLQVAVDTAAPDTTTLSPSLAVTTTGVRNQTPLLSWTDALDAGSGLDHYEISAGTTQNATDIAPWTNQGKNLTGLLSGLSLNDGTFYVNLRAVDKAQNISAPISLAFVVQVPPFTVGLHSPASSPASDSTPTLLVENISTGDIVRVYTEPTCSVSLASATSSSSSAEITVPMLGADGTYNFYVTVENGGYVSPCSSGPSYTLDTIAPTLTLSSPTPAVGNAGTAFIWTATYTGADVITLSSADITLTENAGGCSVSVSGTGISTRQITVQGCTGNGPLKMTVASMTASDTAGNKAPSIADALGVTVDNTPPVLSITSPSPNFGNSSTLFTWTINFSGADTINLASSHIKLTGPAATNCSVTINSSDSTTRHVLVSGCTGTGALDMSVNPGAAMDNAGNASATTSGLSATLDQTNYVIQFASAQDEVTEGSTIGTTFLTATISPIPTVPVTVKYAVNLNQSTAQNPADHNLASVGTLTFPANTGSISLNYSQIGNAIPEVSKILQVDLVNYSGLINASFGTFQSFRRVIRDDDGGYQSFTQVSAGINHACAITTLGKLKCWGNNSNGQLGDGTTNGSPTPINIDSSNTYISVSAGDRRTCAIRSDYTLVCWGYNFYGQIGDGSQSDRLIPVIIDAGTQYSEVSAKYQHTCAISKPYGFLKCWGLNNFGQLGVNDTNFRVTPTAVDGSTPYLSIATGYYHSCGITASNELRCWGYNSDGELGDGTLTNQLVPKAIDPGSSYSKLALNGFSSCAITTGSLLRCWGANGSGQLGDGSNVQRVSPIAVSGSMFYMSVAAGYNHTCGITTGGSVNCWGANHLGALGDGTFLARNTPLTIDDTGQYTKIAAGNGFSCALNTSGKLSCWGENDSGQLGIGSTSERATPRRTDSDSSYTKISVSNNHACGITNEGAIKCWGGNTYGQLGRGTTKASASPVQIDKGTLYADVTTGLGHTCALTQIGLVKCWGLNGQGQLGKGDSVDKSTPTAIDLSTLYTQLASGNYHTCGITLGGKLKCWGLNNYGQLGDGTTSTRYSPVFIDSSETYIKIAATNSTTCGITSSNNLKCWGSNYYGQVGDGTNVDKLSPTLIDSLEKYTQIAGGISHTCGLTQDGKVKCWGSGANGQTGNGVVGSTSLTPAPAASGLTFTSIFAGGYNTCGIKSTNDLYCWGGNNNGQLGDGTWTERYSPVNVDPGITYSKISIAYSVACGVTTSGILNCWGSSTQGQLGDGRLFTPTPVVQ